MDPKRIYTRANLDPNPPIVFENIERILRKTKSKVDKDTYQLYKSISLPVGQSEPCIVCLSLVFVIDVNVEKVPWKACH